MTIKAPLALKTEYVLYGGTVASLLVLAPLFRAANRPLPLLVLEIISFALLCGVARHHLKMPYFSRQLRWILATLLFLPLFYLIPIPFSVWQALPGRDWYAQAMQLSIETTEGVYRAISLFPAATEASWFALLPPLAIFLTVTILPRRILFSLVLLFLGIATAEAVLALIQYGDGPNSVFRLGNPNYTDSGVGTYANRNHLAGLLEMAFPLGLGFLAGTLSRAKSVISPSEQRLRSITLYSFICVLILVGLIFTRSRSGIALGALGIVLCALTYARYIGRKSAFGFLGGVVAFGLGAAVLAGIAPVWQRFAMHDPFEDVRWLVYSTAIRAIGWFFPLGSGPGTFSQVYPRFQSVQLQQYVNHAHNDYLEWLVEGGLFAALLIFALLTFYCLRWYVLWKNRLEGGQWMIMQLGAGIGVFLMLLHGLTDFNLHIPANAIFFAFLAGIFFHALDEPVSTANKAEPAALITTENNLPSVPATQPAQTAKNPFLD